MFTTSYDLMLYWCAGYETFGGFADLFCCNGRLEFDREKTVVPHGDTGLLYLHGALHLLTSQDGVARKRRSTGACLLEQFGTPDRHNPLARPLLVAEGSAGEKARIIQGSAYLSFALDCLSHHRGALVVFGLGLRDQDAHLARALNARPRRPIAVALRPGEKGRSRSRQARLRQILDTDALYFFDATTHPLGSPGLSLSGGR